MERTMPPLSLGKSNVAILDQIKGDVKKPYSAWIHFTLGLLLPALGVTNKIVINVLFHIAGRFKRASSHQIPFIW